MEIKNKGVIVFCVLWVPFAIMALLSRFTFNHLAYQNSQIVSQSTSYEVDHSSLEEVLDRTSMKDKTVILTFLNEAWATPNSVFDLFLESFRKGNQTEELLKHIVVIAVDQKAYARCLELELHCYNLISSQGKINGTDYPPGELYYMTGPYFELMWRRVGFLISVLEHGYNFVFTDCDILWFRNPFPRFYPDVDFQIACDQFKGDAKDLKNLPNGGFIYAVSNNRTIEFYKYWYASRKDFPGVNEQDVFNKIKFKPFMTKIGLSLRFLDTKYFSGFCQPSKDLNQVCTMHANCCFGLENKIYDLNILLQDWTRFLSVKSSSQPTTWTVPQKCLNPYHPPDPPKNKTQHA